MATESNILQHPYVPMNLACPALQYLCLTYATSISVMSSIYASSHGFTESRSYYVYTLKCLSKQMMPVHVSTISLLVHFPFWFKYVSAPQPVPTTAEGALRKWSTMELREHGSSSIKEMTSPDVAAVCWSAEAARCIVEMNAMLNEIIKKHAIINVTILLCR